MFKWPWDAFPCWKITIHNGFSFLKLCFNKMGRSWLYICAVGSVHCTVCSSSVQHTMHNALSPLLTSAQISKSHKGGAWESDGNSENMLKYRPWFHLCYSLSSPVLSLLSSHSSMFFLFHHPSFPLKSFFLCPLSLFSIHLSKFFYGFISFFVTFYSLYHISHLFFPVSSFFYSMSSLLLF